MAAPARTRRARRRADQCACGCGCAAGAAADAVDSLEAQVKTPAPWSKSPGLPAPRRFAGAPAGRLRLRGRPARRARPGARRGGGPRRNAPPRIRARRRGRQELERTVGQGAGTAGQRGQLGGERPLGRRLEGGRVAVPPPAVLAPDRVHDELRLVVDRAEIGPGLQSLGGADGVDGVVEAAAGVHDRQRLVDERIEEVRRVGQRLADPVGAEDREPVSGQEELGVEREHAAQGVRPLARVALHLLGVAGVG